MLCETCYSRDQRENDCYGECLTCQSTDPEPRNFDVRAHRSGISCAYTCNVVQEFYNYIRSLFRAYARRVIPAKPSVRLQTRVLNPSHVPIWAEHACVGDDECHAKMCLMRSFSSFSHRHTCETEVRNTLCAYAHATRAGRPSTASIYCA